MKKTFKIFFTILIILIIFIYAAGLYFFKDRFMPRTYVNGRDFGLTKISEFEKNYNDLSKNFVLEVVSKDKENNEKITASEINYEDNIGSGFVDQTPFYWPVASLVPKNYEIEHEMHYDDNALSNRINDLKVVKNEKVHSADAKVIYNGRDFEIEEEVYGDFVKRNELRNSILNHFADKDDKLLIR